MKYKINKKKTFLTKIGPKQKCTFLEFPQQRLLGGAHFGTVARAAGCEA